MDNVFDVFEQQPYTFVRINRGGAYGVIATEEIEAMGVFKLRNEQVSVNNQELRQSAATLHIRPDETFATSNLVGNGIVADGQEYEIIAQTGGRNYETNEVEHYRLTLQNAKIVRLTNGS